MSGKSKPSDPYQYAKSLANQLSTLTNDHLFPQYKFSFNGYTLRLTILDYLFTAIEIYDKETFDGIHNIRFVKNSKLYRFLQKHGQKAIQIIARKMLNEIKIKAVIQK